MFLFIIDALRLDFLSLQSRQDSHVQPVFRNVHQLLRFNSADCFFLGFQADAPTVTSQRLKGMTTGTFPTFIDAGSNLKSSFITEDNIIDQIAIHGLNSHGLDTIKSKEPRSNESTCDRRAVEGSIVIGDDTWKALFPFQFERYRVYDSFNTQDLDSVDLHSIMDLIKVLKSPPLRNLTIIHFLGVDHIGHTHNAHDPRMTTRLQFMDALLPLIIHHLPQDSLLLLMGDHGMTDQGEHGGASQHETESGLFVYSKRTKPLTKTSHHTEKPEKSPQMASKKASTGLSYKKKPKLEILHLFNETFSKQPLKSLVYDSLQQVPDEAFLLPLGPDPCENTTIFEFEHGAFKSLPLKDYIARPLSIPQIDLVPTLATLLDIPIPFSSMGKLIPNFFNRLVMNSNANPLTDSYIDALLSNALQV